MPLRNGLERWQQAAYVLDEVMHVAAGKRARRSLSTDACIGWEIIGSEMPIRMWKRPADEAFGRAALELLPCDEYSCVMSVPHLTAGLGFDHYSGPCCGGRRGRKSRQAQTTETLS